MLASAPVLLVAVDVRDAQAQIVLVFTSERMKR